jgi:hypothetical protein
VLCGIQTAYAASISACLPTKKMALTQGDPLSTRCQDKLEIPS